MKKIILLVLILLIIIVFYSVRKPRVSTRGKISRAHTGFKAPCELSNGVYLVLFKQEPKGLIVKFVFEKANSDLINLISPSALTTKRFFV